MNSPPKTTIAIFGGLLNDALPDELTNSSEFKIDFFNYSEAELMKVITGKNQSMASLTKGPNVVIPFRSDVGNFLVKICLAS